MFSSSYYYSYYYSYSIKIYQSPKPKLVLLPFPPPLSHFYPCPLWQHGSTYRLFSSPSSHHQLFVSLRYRQHSQGGGRGSDPEKQQEQITNSNRATASSKKRNCTQAQIFVQEGIPTAEEFVICNKEQNLMAKISFRYEKHTELFEPNVRIFCTYSRLLFLNVTNKSNTAKQERNNKKEQQYIPYFYSLHFYFKPQYSFCH